MSERKRTEDIPPWFAFRLNSSTPGLWSIQITTNSSDAARPKDETSAPPDTAAILPPVAERSHIGLVIADPVHRRLVESSAIQLELAPILLDLESMDAVPLATMEIIVADAGAIATLRPLVERRDEQNDEKVPPTIIAVLPEQSLSDHAAAEEQAGARYGPVLTLPQPPAQLTAQLSLLLYAHRAYALRYHNAMEELHLNRRIFRSVTSGISIANALDPNLPLTYVNPAFEVMTGYSLEEVLGTNCRFLQGKENNQPALTLIREAIQSRREVTVILRNFRKDGSPFWNELSISPVRNRDGEITHFVGIQNDITSRVEFEATLRESEKLAAVGRLASSIAHEINNPLESVMNLVYLAARTDDLAQTRHCRSRTTARQAHHHAVPPLLQAVHQAPGRRCIRTD